MSRDFSASALAPAFWKLMAVPGHPVVIERLAPDGPFESARYEVESPAQIVPSLEAIGCGLFKVTDHYRVASGEVREAQRYYLVAGRFSLIHLSDALGAAIEGALA
jgi:hypothetical protein